MCAERLFPMDQKNHRQSNRAFSFTFAVVFTVVGVIAWFGFDTVLYWPFVLGALFALLAVTVPWLVMPLNRLWGAFATRLAAFNNKLIMGLVFFVVMTPLGLLLRSRDVMRRKVGRSGAVSYLQPVGKQPTVNSMHDLF